MAPQELMKLLELPYEADLVQALVNSLGPARVKGGKKEEDEEEDEDDRPDDEIWHCFPQHGLTLIVSVENGLVEGIILDAAGPRSPAGYKGELPLGLKFGMTKKAVRKLLGKPNVDQPSGALDVETWDRDSYYISVQYDDRKEGVAFVAILSSPGA